MCSDLRGESGFLDPTQLKLYREPSGTFKLVLGEAEYPGIAMVRLFPLSNPKHFLVINDSEGREIGVIKDPEELERETREIVLEAAEKAYHICGITKIKSLKDVFGIAEWEVETTEGFRSFEVRGGRDNIRIIGRRAIITDVEGNRFEIADRDRLDSKSRSLIELYI